MDCEMVSVGPFQSNAVIFWDAPDAESSEGRPGILIDPGWDGERLLEKIERRGLEIQAILLTHAHLDHVNAVGALKQATGAPIYLHRAELPLYEQVERQAELFGLDAEPLPPVDHFLAEGDTISLGQLRIDVLETPGHSPGGVSFHVASEGIVAVGDTLFQGSIGRSDLWGGDHEQLLRSIRERLLTLDPDTRVLPGHGPETTVGLEARTNPFLV